MIITAFASIYFDISIKMSQELRTYGANFFVGSDESTDKRTIDSSVYQDVLKAIPSDKLVGGSPYLYGIVRIDLGKVVMAGVQFSGLKKLSPFWQVDGNWINVDFDEARRFNYDEVNQILRGEREDEIGWIKPLFALTSRLRKKRLKNAFDSVDRKSVV